MEYKQGCVKSWPLRGNLNSAPLSSKSEIRNSKSETNPNTKEENEDARSAGVPPASWQLGSGRDARAPRPLFFFAFSDLFRISTFGFRILKRGLRYHARWRGEIDRHYRRWLRRRLRGALPGAAFAARLAPHALQPGEPFHLHAAAGRRGWLVDQPDARRLSGAADGAPDHLPHRRPDEYRPRRPPRGVSHRQRPARRTGVRSPRARLRLD